MDLPRLSIYWALREDSDFQDLRGELEEYEAEGGVLISDGSLPESPASPDALILLGPGPFPDKLSSRGIWLADPDREQVLGALAILQSQIWATKSPEPGSGKQKIAPTPREQEVLDLLAQGLPNKAIASELDISMGTVKFHISRLMQKTLVQTRAELVLYAAREGWIAV